MMQYWMRLGRRERSRDVACYVSNKGLRILDWSKLSLALLFCPGLSDVNIPIEILELNFLAAAVDRATHILVDLDPILATLSAIVFHGLLRSGGLHLNVKVTVNIAIVSAKAHVGLKIGRESNIDIAVQRAECH